jgi:hypothetical protein
MKRKFEYSDERRNIWGPSPIIAENVGDHAAKVTDTAGFGVNEDSPSGHVSRLEGHRNVYR